MKKFTYESFRNLFYMAEYALTEAKLTDPPENMLLNVNAIMPDGSKLFSWDSDYIVWLSAIITNAKAYEVFPFVKRRRCLRRLIAAHSDEFEPRFIRQIDGITKIHPAIYHAAGNAEVIDEHDDVEFGLDTFRMALTEWVLQKGY